MYGGTRPNLSIPIALLKLEYADHSDDTYVLFFVAGGTDGGENAEERVVKVLESHCFPLHLMPADFCAENQLAVLNAGY